ncbi:hypothetical protein MKW92_027359 [Papaver armeniacum]|nr:hypothetical protein MKW92_027359 [Papaver armeniacum]
MGERKVQCHYFPPDLDLAKIPKMERKKQQDCRWMLPMSIRCKTCGNYMGRVGTKVNTRKEVVDGETYLGILIHRVYFKCSTCSAEFTIKSDPQNSDYTVEFGATRNFEPWRVELNKRMDAEGDPLKSLEKRTRVSKREMDIDAAIFRNKEIVLRIHDEEDQAVRTVKTKIGDNRNPTTSSLTKCRFLRPASRGEELNLSNLISKSSCVRLSVIKKPRTVLKS